MRTRQLLLTGVFALGLGAWSAAPMPAVTLPPVHHAPGTLHGFLVLRSIDGAVVGDGELIQTASGDRITTRTTFHFHDGSLNDETAVFSVRGVYRLISDRLVQRGPMFEHPLTLEIDMPKGRVVVHSTDEHGADKVSDQQMTLPADLGNGLLITLVQDIGAADLPRTIPFLAATPGTRLVKLVVTRTGSAPFSIGKLSQTAAEYLVKTDIGGVAGVVAPIVGKQPADAHVWVLTGDAPVFVKSEAPLFPGGPILRIELTSPQWPR